MAGKVRIKHGAISEKNVERGCIFNTFRFMWIMGVCIPFSVKSIIKKDVPMGVSLTNVWRRSAKLFLLGFFWNTLGA